MAINFPNSPTDGQIYGNYTYDVGIPGWRKTPENAASLPAGTIVQWPGATAPANWLICDGSAVSRSTYASLFAAIGVQYGAGDGTTTFNLPNLKGRVAVGLDDSQSEFNVLGETGGAKTHTLVESELPAHTHSNTLTNATVSSSSHTHSGGSLMARLYQYFYQAASGTTWTASNSNNYTIPGASGSSTNQGVAVAGTTGTPSATTTVGITNVSAGLDGAHNNLQPYIVLNYIIKTSAGVTAGDSELATRVGVVETENNATPLSQNYLINGAFDMWQRGTSLPHGGGAVGVDMWREYTDSGSGTQSKDTADYPEGLPAQSYKFTAGANSTNWVIWQIIESMNCAEIVGKTVTFSVYLKSSVARTFRMSFGVSTTVDAAWTGSWSTSDFEEVSVTTSWARYTLTTTVPSTAKTVQFSVSSNGANMANASTINVAGAQVEVGSYATPFRRNAPSIQAELAACQRYYTVFNSSKASSLFGYYGTGSMYQATLGVVVIHLPVEMRAVPTMTYSAASTFQALTSGANVGISAVGTTDLTRFTATVHITTSISLNSNSAFTFRGNGVASSIAASAEL